MIVFRTAVNDLHILTLYKDGRVSHHQTNPPKITKLYAYFYPNSPHRIGRFSLLRIRSIFKVFFNKHKRFTPCLLIYSNLPNISLSLTQQLFLTRIRKKKLQQHSTVIKAIQEPFLKKKYYICTVSSLLKIS